MSIPLPTFAVALLFTAALYFDIRYRTIPNRLTVPAMLFGAAFHMLAGPLAEGLLFTITGAVTCGCLLIVPFALGGMGGGDVKLLMGVGAWMGAEASLYVFAFGALAGALIALAMMVFRRTTGDWRAVANDAATFLLTGRRWATASASGSFPYSIALAAGFAAYGALGQVP